MSDNAQAFIALDAFLDRLRRSEELDSEASEDVAKALDAKVAENIAAQRDPYGHLFVPSQSGKPVLTKAHEAVTCVANGTTIEMSVTGVEARHHIGNARGYHGGSAKLGGFRRPIIPFKDIPGPMKSVIRETLEKRFAKIHQGGK